MLLCFKSRFILIITWFLFTSFAGATPIPEIWEAPQRNPYFVGRDAELEQINNILKKHSVVYITGIGGIGKTQIAKEYLHRNLKYDLVWWFDLSKDMGVQYESLFKAIMYNSKFNQYIDVDANKISPDAKLKYVNNVLRKAGMSWLLVFDNCNDEDTLGKIIPEIHNYKNKHVLITTRLNINDKNRSIKVGNFLNKDAINFLKQNLGNLKEGDFQLLAATLHRYPLQLCHAVKYMSAAHLSPKEYIVIYKENHSKILQDSFINNKNGPNDYYKDTVFSVLESSLKNLKTKNKGAYGSLLELSLMGTKISQDMFESIIKNNGLNNALVRKTLQILEDSFLVEISQEGLDKYVSLHDVVKDYLIYHINLDTDTKKIILGNLVSVINKQISDEIFNKFNLLDKERQNIVVAANVLSQFFDVGEVDNNSVQLAIKVMKANNILFSKYAKYSDYQKIAEKVFMVVTKEMSKAKRVPELYMELIFADFLYDNRHIRTNYEKFFLKSIKEANEDKTRQFFAYTQASQYYLFMRDLTKAHECILKAERALKYSRNLSEKLQFYYTYSWLLLELRKLEEGMKKLEEYKTFIDTYYIKGIVKLYYLNLKGKYLYLNGDKKKALAISVESIKLANTYYQNTNNNISGEGLVTQAQIALDDNDTAKATQLLREAGSVLSNLFGGESIDLTQAFIKTLLGEVSLKKQNFNQAIDDFARAENYYKKIKLSDSIESEEELRLYKNLAKIWYLRQDYEKSKYYFKKLVSYKGFDHEHVYSLLAEFGDKYLDQEKL